MGTLDARGLKCPLPVLKARKASQSLKEGEELVVLADDPGAPADFRHFCEVAGFVMIEEREGNAHRFRLRKIEALKS